MTSGRLKDLLSRTRQSGATPDATARQSELSHVAHPRGRDTRHPPLPPASEGANPDPPAPQPDLPGELVAAADGILAHPDPPAEFEAGITAAIVRELFVRPEDLEALKADPLWWRVSITEPSGASILIGDHVMGTNDPTATPSPESEPLGFQTLLYRLRSVMHRLKVSADSFEDFAEGTPEKYVSAAFAIQELPPELDRLYDDFDYWHAVNIERPARKAEAAAQVEAAKEVQS